MVGVALVFKVLKLEINGCTNVDFCCIDYGWIIVHTLVYTSKNTNVEFEWLYKTIILTI